VWWRGVGEGEDPYIGCGHVQYEEYWGVCNGTYLQGRFIRASLRKEMLHFNRAVPDARGVCLSLHSADDARPLTFLSISLFSFL
jgi:hypothetical protein